jgi:L-glutamine:2-deoxy-scyllo-inosose/3-amino-2,3-dideoxy-scyllo-inosose aminotransferase
VTTFERLALHGGSPVVSRPWPTWPMPAPEAERHLHEVLHGGRWTLSGPRAGAPSWERRFAEAFARYHGVRYCVPTSGGSTALLVALEAMGIEPNDEVIVPGLTWVACASVVLRLNAIPVLVDVDPDTFCITAQSIRQGLSERTRAIMLVHLYSAVAELDEIKALADERGLVLVEDCAQAHGARWRGGRMVGTVGALGTFSLQQGKPLTCGEGGAVITDDEPTWLRLQELRADGRRYAEGPLGVGDMELVVGHTQGSNHCLSELHAALALAQLAQLEACNERREANARRLDALLEQLGPFTPQRTSEGTERRTYYQYAVRIEPAAFDGIELDRLAQALRAELGFPVNRTYAPLDRNPLYRPQRRRRFAGIDPSRGLDPGRFSLPRARRIHDTTLTLHHPLLLAGPEDMDAVAEAMDKVHRLRHELR